MSGDNISPTNVKVVGDQLQVNGTPLPVTCEEQGRDLYRITAPNGYSFSASLTEIQHWAPLFSMTSQGAPATAGFQGGSGRASGS